MRVLKQWATTTLSFLTRLYTTFCGGSATEDVNYIRENTLEQLKCFKVPSADTILRGDVELATACKLIKTNNGKDNKINVNTKMNAFLINTFTGDAYKYMFIMTNDWEMSDKQVIEFYNHLKSASSPDVLIVYLFF